MPGGKGAHGRHPLVDLLAEQHAAPARLGPLADHDLDGVGQAQVGGVEPVAGRQALVHQRADALRSSGVMPPSPVVVEVPTAVAARPRASLAWADRAPKLMPAMVIGMSSSIGLAPVAGAEHGPGLAALPVALQRVTRGGRGQEDQVVEGGQLAAWRPRPRMG